MRSLCWVRRDDRDFFWFIGSFYLSDCLFVRSSHLKYFVPSGKEKSPLRSGLVSFCDSVSTLTSGASCRTEAANSRQSVG